MKRFFIIMMLVMASVTVFAQSKTYTVKVGETIESIAHKHGVSVAALLQANPEAAENCYVGMKLIIPSGKQAMVGEAVVVKGDKLDSRKGEGSFVGEVSFQYLLFGGGTSDFYKGFRGGMSTNFGYRYYVHHNVFMEASLGYRWYTYETINKFTTTVHNITLPIHIGGYLDVTEKFGLRPFFGPRVDFPVSSRIKYGSLSDSADVKIGVTLEFGLDFNFNNWGIRTKYGLGVGDYKNMNYVSIGFTTGI